jgi:hypothetical protein
MVRNAADEPQFSPAHAAYILRRALADRKLTAADIRRYSASIQDEIAELESRLADLKEAVVGQVRKVWGRATGEVTTRRGRRPSKRRRATVSPEIAASRKLQGQYLGFIRQIPASQRAGFKKMATQEGREKAVAAMKKRLGK